MKDEIAVAHIASTKKALMKNLKEVIRDYHAKRWPYKVKTIEIGTFETIPQMYYKAFLVL